jgi:hypothetical protein
METTPKDIIEKLVEKAEGYKFLGTYRSCDYSQKTSQERYRDSQEVGQLVLRSSEHDRELLKQLTSIDMEGVRYPAYDYQKYLVDEKTKKLYVDPTWRPTRKRSSVVRLPHEK